MCYHALSLQNIPFQEKSIEKHLKFIHVENAVLSVQMAVLLSDKAR